jgi:hypothetical protein
MKIESPAVLQPLTQVAHDSAGPGAAIPTQMQVPAFFDAAPRIAMQDALAETLGAAKGGIIEYTYLDAVKLAGHSCPTVAGAYLMTRAALARLYPGETPRRGELRVELRDAQEAGVVGVVANVAALITGAAGPGGFKGLAGRHVRRGLLAFGVPMRGEMRFTRLDTGTSVEVSFRMDALPRTPTLTALMQAALAPNAAAVARSAFAQAWQERVRAILLDHADDPALVSVEA